MKKEANQSSDPTSMAVTICAAAQLEEDPVGWTEGDWFLVMVSGSDDQE